MFSPIPLLFGFVFLGAYVGIFFDMPYNVAFGISLVAGLTAAASRKNAIQLGSLLVACVFFVGGLASLQQTEFRSAQFPKEKIHYEGSIEYVGISLDGSKTGVLKLANSSRRLSFGLKDSASLIAVHPGDRVRIFGKVRPMQKSLSPGELDGQLFGLARQIDGHLFVNRFQHIKVIQSVETRPVFASARYLLQERLLKLITPREAGLVLALVVGDTKLFDQEQREIYRKVGAGHLLAVSGLQVSLLAAIFFLGIRFFLLLIGPIGRRSLAGPLAAVIALGLVWAFAFLCQNPPSAVRAAGMASALLIGQIFGRPISLLTAFCLTGFITILVLPASIVDPSFLLSYAAVLGLLIAIRPRSSFERMQNLLGKDETPSKMRARWALALVLSSVAASLTTGVLSAHMFGQISVAGIFANIFLVPIASLLQVPAIFLGLAGALFDSFWLAKLGASCAGLIEALCEGLSQITSVSWSVEAPSIGISLFLLAILALLWISMSYRRWLASGILTAVFSLTLFLPRVFEEAGVRITILPVGQGDSAAIEFPTGQVMLIDGGGEIFATEHPSSEIVAAFLKRRHIDRIDWMVVSHPDPDHILGLIGILEQFEVGEVWHSGFDERHPLMAKLLAVAKNHRVPVKGRDQLRDQLVFAGSLIEIFAPNPTLTLPSPLKGEGTNDQSLVLRISMGGSSVLFPGDIEKIGEKRLLQRQPELTATIVKAPHHGSKTSSTQAFVDATKAKHVVFCTKDDNLWGFPHSQVVERWQNVGASLWNTGTDGEITIWLTKAGAKISAFRGQAYAKSLQNVQSET